MSEDNIGMPGGGEAGGRSSEDFFIPNTPFKRRINLSFGVEHDENEDPNQPVIHDYKINKVD